MILASASSARAELLRAAGLTITIDPAHIDETAIKAAMLSEGAPPRDVADVLAETKASRVSARHPGTLTLGADQVLVFEGEIIDKSPDIEAAHSTLHRLSGQTHKLISAAVIARDGAPLWRHISEARLTMRPLSDPFLDSYLERCGQEVLSAVGCYHLEGLGAQLFQRIEGDYFTILGLPLLEVLGFLRLQGELME